MPHSEKHEPKCFLPGRRPKYAMIEAIGGVFKLVEYKGAHNKSKPSETSLESKLSTDFVQIERWNLFPTVVCQAENTAEEKNRRMNVCP